MTELVWVRETTGEESGHPPEHVAMHIGAITRRARRVDDEVGTFYVEQIVISYNVVPAHDTLIHTHVHDSSGIVHEHEHAHHPGQGG